jgi:hypothetical protein
MSTSSKRAPSRERLGVCCPRGTLASAHRRGGWRQVHVRLGASATWRRALGFWHAAAHYSSPDGSILLLTIAQGNAVVRSDCRGRRGARRLPPGRNVDNCPPDRPGGVDFCCRAIALCWTRRVLQCEKTARTQTWNGSAPKVGLEVLPRCGLRRRTRRGCRGLRLSGSAPGCTLPYTQALPGLRRRGKCAGACRGLGPQGVLDPLTSEPAGREVPVNGGSRGVAGPRVLEV